MWVQAISLLRFAPWQIPAAFFEKPGWGVYENDSPQWPGSNTASFSLCDITSWDQGVYNCLSNHKKSWWCLAENSQKLFIYQPCRYNAMPPPFYYWACSCQPVWFPWGRHSDNCCNSMKGVLSPEIRSQKKKETVFVTFFFLGERQCSLRVWFQWMSPNQKVCEEHKLGEGLLNDFFF